MLVGMRSALGFGQAITEPSAASLIGDYYPPDQRGKAFSIQQVMLLAGTGVGVGLGGFIGTNWGWRPALVIVALPGLLVADARVPHARAEAGHRRHDGGHRRRVRPARRRGRPRRSVRAGVRPVPAGHDLRAQGGHASDPRHPHDALRARRCGGAALHRDRPGGLAPPVLRAPPPHGGGHWRGALHRPDHLRRRSPACSSADGWPIATPTKMQGGRLALPAIFIAGGNLFFTAAYLLRSRRATRATSSSWSPSLQLIGLFIMTMSIPGLRAGLTDAIPAHLRGAGFGAFNLVAVVCGQAAAPFIVVAHLRQLRREPPRGVPRLLTTARSSAPPSCSGPASSSTRT